MAGGKASAKKIALAERRQAAVELRVQGATYRQIAVQLIEEGLAGPRYTGTEAHGDVQALLEARAAASAENLETVRQLELDRLEELHQAFWQLAIQRDPIAFDRILKVMERRARYLPLEVPRELNVNPERLDLLLAEALAELAALRQESTPLGAAGAVAGDESAGGVGTGEAGADGDDGGGD